VPGCRVAANVLAVGSVAGNGGLTLSRGALPMMRAAGNGTRSFIYPFPPNLLFRADARQGWHGLGSQSKDARAESVREDERRHG
jgi:hypothetical protein